MKNIPFVGIALSLALLLFSCSTVIRKDYMEVGIRNVPLSEVKQKPDLYKRKLFILGGIIANDKVTPEGSLLEAVHVTVDSRGYLSGYTDGRYLAFLPKEGGMLDPVIFSYGKMITIAAEFEENRTGKIDEAEYLFPFFVIKEIYLWQEKDRYDYPPPYFYYPYYPPWWW